MPDEPRNECGSCCEPFPGAEDDQEFDVAVHDCATGEWYIMAFTEKARAYFAALDQAEFN